jgi:hypothetical protein
MPSPPLGLVDGASNVKLLVCGAGNFINNAHVDSPDMYHAKV